MPNSPRKWAAALLGFFAQPIGMLYVVQPQWAAAYLLVTLAIAIVGEFYIHQIPLMATGVQLLLALACAIHAYRLAARYPEGKPRPDYSRWYGLLGTLLGLVTMVFGLRALIIEPFRFPSASMLPTIEAGSHLIVKKWGYGNYGTYGLNIFHTAISSSLNRGDIIVFESPPDRSIIYAKRLIGLPGDRVTFRDKKLFVNDNPVPTRRVSDYCNTMTLTYTPMFIESLADTEYPTLIEDSRPPYVSGSTVFPLRDKCRYSPEGVTCEVPAGHYYAVGDNRDNSNDSRMWGFVPADHIVGKVLYVLP